MLHAGHRYEPHANQHHHQQQQHAPPPQTDVVLREYEVDHLASLTSSPQLGALSPSDALEKLRQMEASTGIWTMRSSLELHSTNVLVTEKQSGEVMERFPLRQIRNPVAVSGENGHRTYNNIFLFSVYERDGSCEMHIFQSIFAPASRIASEIGNLISGRQLDPERSPDHRQQQQQQQHVEVHHHQHQHILEPWNRNIHSANRIETGSNASENSEILVKVLNRCFDEIESFVFRLREAASAYKELSKRTRDQKRKGLYEMRSRLPGTEHFVDIFKKFKVCFNILAALEGQIHQPNAPELVHFLFTPLALIVEANGGPELAGRVLSPLLTSHAISLLKHCLTSRESELWYSLGNVWTLTRSHWLQENAGTDIPVFRLIFRDGWEPNLEPELLGQGHNAVTSPRAHLSHHRDASNLSFNSPRGFNDITVEPQLRAQPPRASNVQRASSNLDNIAAVVANQAAEVQRRQARYDAHDRYPRRPVEPASRPQPPPLAAPDPREYQAYVDNRADRSRPSQFQRSSPRPPAAAVDELPLAEARLTAWSDRQGAFRREVEQRGHRVVQATHDKMGKNNKELTVAKGELLEVLDESRNWWKLRNCVGEVGHAPYTVLRPI